MMTTDYFGMMCNITRAHAIGVQAGQDVEERHQRQAAKELELDVAMEKLVNKFGLDEVLVSLIDYCRRKGHDLAVETDDDRGWEDAADLLQEAADGIRIDDTPGMSLSESEGESVASRQR